MKESLGKKYYDFLLTGPPLVQVRNDGYATMKRMNIGVQNNDQKRAEKTQKNGHARQRTGMQRAFTIVEVVIVITVIAILSAIVYVSYTAVLQASREETVKADAQTIGAALNKYKSEQGVYPSSLEALGVKTAGSTFQYTYNATAGSYCVTASVRGASVYVQSGTIKTTPGGCVGHGINGEGPVTNLAINPSATATTGYSAAGAAGSTAIVNSTGYSGNTFIRRTFSAAGAGGQYYTIGSSASPSVTPGKSYTASVWMRGSSAVNTRAAIEWKNSSGIISSSNGTYVAANASSWRKIVVTGVAPAAATHVTITMYISGSPQWIIGDYQDIDAVMFTEGSREYAYADGSTENWIWNGTPNASTSTGPGL